MSVKVKKAKGPLQNTLRVTDDLKKQFDDLLHDTLEKDVLEPAVKKDFYQRCIHLKNLVEKNMEALQNLRKSDEPAPVGSYELLKEEGEQRLLKLSEKLQKLTLTLAQGDGELREPSIRTQSKASVGEDDIDEDSEEQEDEEDDEDEEEEEEDCDDKEEEDEDDPEFDSVIKEFITLGDFQAQQKDDLTIQKGEVLLILDKRPDGWWVAQNSKGIKGIVPKTYLEVFKKGEENQDPSEEETEEEEEEEEEKAAADDEKSASKKRPAEDTVSQTSSVKKTQEMSTTDALIVTGTIPAGFCSSTLAQLLEQGEHFRTSMYLQPELSPSQLSFKDLQWDHEQDCIQVLPTRVSCILTLWSCKMIPLPAASIQILSRHVRLCLSDGAKVLSNIHTVRATWQPKNSKTWTFSPRVTGILPSLLDGGCFARTGSQSADIGILFELGITYIRNSTGERGELSCGWTFLKLFDVNGVPVPPKTYELTLNGGTPYERGIEVDPTISRRGRSD